MKYILITILFILLLVGLVAFLNQDEHAANPEPSFSDFSVDGSERIVNKDDPLPGKKVVVNNFGESIQVNDFITNSAAKSVGEGMYHISYESAEVYRPYSLLFNEEDSSFAIALLDKPFGASREVASSDFLILLGITEEQACSINIFISVPFELDERLSGTNYGLSYCPNALPL